MKDVRRVLLVDDDERFRKRMAQALTDRGLVLTTAAGAAPALDALGRESFDAVVTDLRMPGVKGLEFVGRLRSEFPELPLVVLTGYGTIASAVSAMRLGVRDYLVKPCSADQLYALLTQGDPDADPELPDDAELPTEQELAAQIPSLARLEREHIERVLLECGGNVSKAARVLGIHRRTLQYKLLKFPVSR